MTAVTLLGTIAHDEAFNYAAFARTSSKFVPNTEPLKI